MPTDSTNMTVRLVGADDADDAVFLTDFRHFCAGMEACLRRAEKLAAGHSGRVADRIAGLAMGIRKTVAVMQRGKRLDGPVGSDEVALFKNAGSTIGHETRLPPL